MRKKRNFVIALGIGLIVTACAVFGFMSFSDLKSKNSLMAFEYEMLNNKYDKLLKESNNLKAKIESLNGQISDKNELLDFYISEIQKKTLSSEKMATYKQRANQLITELDELIAEKKILDYKYAKEKFNHYKTGEENKDLKVAVAELKDANKNLKHKLKTEKSPHIYSVNIESFNEKNNGVLISTDKARKVDIIQTCINVDGFKSDSKTDVIFQMLTPDFRTISTKDSYGRNNTKLNYTKKINASELSKVKNYCFEVDFDYHRDKLKKGKYILNIYDKSGLISRAFFSLR